MIIKALTLNLFMYKGYPEDKYKDNRKLVIETLFNKIETLILKKNINILFFQEDMLNELENTKNKTESFGFTLGGYCEGEIMETKQTKPTLINSIYIKKTLLNNDTILPNDVLHKKTDISCYGYKDKQGITHKSKRCFVSVKINVGDNNIILVNTHLCGGKYDDLNYKTQPNEKENEILEILETIKLN